MFLFFILRVYKDRDDAGLDGIGLMGLDWMDWMDGIHRIRLDSIGFDWIGWDWFGRSGPLWACSRLFFGLTRLDWIDWDWIVLNWID